MRLATLFIATTVALGACGQTTTARRADQPSPTAAAEPYRAPEDVLRDPAKRFDLMNQLARSIYSKTKTVDDERYYTVVRPSVVVQLRAAGFRPDDAEQILIRSDRSHPTLAKSPGGGGPTHAP
jgi:hypothetical protein